MWDIVKNETLVYRKMDKQQKKDYDSASDAMYNYMVSAVNKIFAPLPDNYRDEVEYFLYLTDELMSICAAGCVFIDGGTPALSVGRMAICKIINIIYEYKLKDIESNEQDMDELIRLLASMSEYMQSESSKMNAPFAAESEETLTWLRIAAKYFSKGHDNIDEQLCEGGVEGAQNYTNP